MLGVMGLRICCRVKQQQPQAERHFNTPAGFNNDFFD
ncbi:hypothetical protein SHLO109777_12660 [Shewanella loihica]